MSGATYTFCGTLPAMVDWPMFGTYAMDVRTFPPAPDAGNSRHHWWMSSATPTWTLAMAGTCVHDVMQNSQFPAVGTPLPGPVALAALSGTTQDWRAGVTDVNDVPCP